ncbi:hypothetical protein A6P54_09795 [Bacillus sp. MKU004]|nr:hypothetical protein A6P54_09795 [Bacillus sp. MKU004]
MSLLAFSQQFPVQLRRLAPRGHKMNGPKRQKTPFRPIHLMLVRAEQAASAFLFVQLQGLEAHVISQTAKKVKNATPSKPIRLMPNPSLQSPSSFLIGVFVLHSNQKLECTGIRDN